MIFIKPRKRRVIEALLLENSRWTCDSTVHSKISEHENDHSNVSLLRLSTGDTKKHEYVSCLCDMTEKMLKVSIDQ